MFSSFKDDASCFNSQPLLENRSQPPFLSGTTAKQTSGPPWDYSQQTFSTVPFYSGDNLNHRHPVVQNPNTVPHMDNSSLLSNYNRNVISGSNIHQSVVRPRAVINCQTNCEACYSHSFTRFPQSWGAASSDCVRYGGGSSITSLPSDDIPRFPPNFPQTDDCSNRFGGDFPSSLNKLSRFSKDAQGITASIPKKNVTSVTDNNLLVQQNHSRSTGISEQYISSLAVDDAVAKTEVCHIACRGMCGQSSCKVYKCSLMKSANLNSTPAQQYGMPRENVVRYTGHAAGVTGGSHWHTQNHQPSRLWLPKGHPPGIWIPPQEPVNNFEHSSAPSLWGERDICDMPSQQFQPQNYEMSSSYKSANQMRTVQSMSYKESMGAAHEERTEKLHERISFHDNAADISRHSADVKRRQEDLTTSEHSARYIEASQRTQQKCDNTGSLFNQDLHYQKPTGRNVHLPSKSYPETEVNKEKCRDPTASTVLMLQNATKALLNSNETTQNYTSPLDLHNDISRKYSFSAPVGNYSTYENHDGKFHSPVLGIAQPPSRFGSHLAHSKISRNSNGVFPDTYVEGSRPLSCQLPSESDSFLNQHMSCDPNKDYASNVIHCPVQNPDAIIRCGSVKDTSEAVAQQVTLGLQSCDKVTNPNLTGYFGTSTNMHDMDSTSRSSNINRAAYNRDSVLTNSFQDSGHSELYQSSGSTFAPNAFINELNYSSKRYTNVPVISRSDKEMCNIPTAYDTSYSQNSPLTSEGSPDRPIKKRKSRMRNVDNMEKRMDNSRNNHILDVRQFLETWDEEMDLSPAPRLPDVVLSSNSAENPLLVLDCRQLGTNGVATLSAVDRSTGNLIQTYQQPLECPSENNEISKHPEQQFNGCASLLPLNPLEEIRKLCNADEKSDAKINKQATPDSQITAQEMPLSNLAAAEFALNDGVNEVDTCGVSDGVIQELMSNQKFQNTKTGEKTNISHFNPLHDGELNKGQTSSSTCRSPHSTLQVAENELADPRRDCRDHISDSCSSNHLRQGATNLVYRTNIIPEGPNSTLEAVEVHIKKSRIQTLKQLCEYVLQDHGTSKHCYENGGLAVNENNVSACRVPLYLSDSKPTEKLSSMPDASETSINVSVQDACKVHHRQTVELPYLLNDSLKVKEGIETVARSEVNNILGNDKVELDDNELWMKHANVEKQTCLPDAKAEITEDKSFKQNAEEENEKLWKDKLKEGNILAKESCELHNIAKISNKISNVITTEVSRNKSNKEQKNQNTDTHTKGDNVLSGGGNLKSILTNKEPEFKTTLSKNQSNERFFGIDAVEDMGYSQPTFNTVKRESEVHSFSNSTEKSDNCESILISTMRSNISSVLANSGSEGDDRYDLDMSVTSSIQSDLDIEQSQARETHSVEITYDETNEFFDSDVMDADELMDSNMTEASDIICCSSAFETSCCKIDDTKGYEKNETKTNQHKDDFSLLGDSPKLELVKCSDQTSEVILPDKLIGGTLVEKTIRNKEELQTEKENISKLQKCSFETLDENLNMDGNIVLNTLKKKISKSNGNNAACAQTDKELNEELNEESVEEIQLDENQNQSLSAKLKIAAKDLCDDADEVLQNSVKAEVKSVQSIHAHSECSEESTAIANDCGLSGMTITKPWAKIKDVAEISNLFNKSTKVHEPSQKSDKPTFDSLEIEHIHLAGHEISTVANVSIMATVYNPETKDCSEFSNFPDAFAKEDVPLQESFDLLVDPLEDVHIDFKCAAASTTVPNGCSIASALITKSNQEAKDHSELLYCSDKSAKEDELLQKSDKLSFKALENLHNLECSEISTTNDCDLPNTIITKSKLKTQGYSNEYNVPDNELALNYDSEERKNKPNIASGNSSLTVENSCGLECDSGLQKNSVNNEFKQNTTNLNPPDLLHNVLYERHNESEQEGIKNIKKLLNNEKRHIGYIKKISEGAVSQTESKKIIIERAFPQVSLNLHTAVRKPTDSCYNLDNNSTNLLIKKNTNQEEEQRKIKSKREPVEQTSKEQLQALEVMDNCLLSQNDTESNTYLQNSNAYCRNNYKDDLQVSDSCELKSVTCEKMYTKYSEGCLCFASSVIKEEKCLQEDKLSCTDVFSVGKGQMAPSRIKINNPAQKEILVNNVLSSVFQKFSNFASVNAKFHVKDNKEEEKEANLVHREIRRSGNAFIRKLQNTNANTEVLEKLRCASKLLSKCEININTQCHAVLENTESLKKQSITKPTNLGNVITDGGDMSLKSTYILQRRFSEPLVRNYSCDVRNKIKLRTSISVTDLNCAYLSDTLAEILRKSKLQIIVKLSTCNSRSETTNNAIMETCKAPSHFLNEQASGCHCIEYLDPTSKTLLQKNKNALKRKISQCISDDELCPTLSKDQSETKKKRNAKGNCFDSDNDKLSKTAIVETRMADKCHINKEILPSDPLSSLTARREGKNTTISLTFVDNKNNEPSQVENVNKIKYDEFVTEEVTSKLNTGISQSNICVESKEIDCKKSSISQNSNLQYILEVSSTELGLKSADIDGKPKKKSMTQFNQPHGCVLNLGGSKNTSFLKALPSLDFKCSTFQVARSVEDESKVEKITQKSNVSTAEIQEVQENEGTLAVESQDSSQVCFKKTYALCTQMCEVAVSKLSCEMQGNESIDKISKSSLAENSKVCANDVESLNMYSVFASQVLKKMEDTECRESVRNSLTANNQQGTNSEDIKDNGNKCIIESKNTCTTLMQRNNIVKGNDEDDQRILSWCSKVFQEDDTPEIFDVVGKIHDVAEKIPDNDLAEHIQDNLVEKIQDNDNQNRYNFEYVVKNIEEHKVKQLQKTEETNLFENSRTSVKFNNCQRKGGTCVPKKINDSGTKQERGVINNLQSRASESVEEESIMATHQKQEIGIKKIAKQKDIEVRGKEAIVDDTNEVLLLRNIQKVDDATGQTTYSNESQNNMMFLKDMTPSDLEMTEIRYESREYDKTFKATVDYRNNIPFPKTNAGNIDVFMPVGNNVYKQTEVSYKNKQGKWDDIQSLCELHCISNAHREKVFDKPLVNDNHIKVEDDSCMTAMQEFTVQESICNDENNSKMEISFIRHNTTITDKAALLIKPKSKNCSSLESHQLCTNKASDRSTGSAVVEIVARGNRLGLLPVMREKNLIVRNAGSKVKELLHISDMQKVEESMEGTGDIATKIETTPVLKVGAQTLILMHRSSNNSRPMINETNALEEEFSINKKFLITGSFSGAISVAPKASILRKDNCSYSSAVCMNNMLVSLTVQKIKILKEIANSISENVKENKDKTEDSDSTQVIKYENDAGLHATKELNLCGISWHSRDLTTNAADQEEGKNKLNCTRENKIKCSSSLCRLNSPDYVKNGTGSIGCKVITLRAGTVPDLFDLVKKNKIIEDPVAENNSMENIHEVDAYVDMPHLEAISTEISSNDSETEMPCLELIDNLEPMDTDHVQELGESSKDKQNAEHYEVEETTEGAGKTKQEEPSEHAKISGNVNSRLSPNPEICVEMQNSLEEANSFQQVCLDAAPKERSSLDILKGESPVFIDSISTNLKIPDKKPEAEVPVDYSVLKSVLPIVNQNTQDTCDSSLKLCRAGTDGWDDLGFPENYSPQSDNSETIVNKEMHFSDKEKFCAETEPPRPFPICTDSDSIPLQILESDTEYMHCMNDELNSKECWTSGKIIDDNGYIAEEEAGDFNPPSQVCSDVLMSNCESELNIQESLELDIPSVSVSAPSRLEPPEIGSSLGDVIPADFVTNWPYLEEEVLCEADNTLCSADSEYQAVHSSSPVEQCLPCDLNGTVNSSVLDSNNSSVHTDSALLGEFKCRLSWKKIFNFSKLDRKQRKKFKKVEKENDDEGIVPKVNSTQCNISDSQNKNIKSQNYVPLNYHVDTTSLTPSNKEFGGLELGPAKIEVRIPRSASTKGLPKVWKVVDRSKPFSVPEAQKENTEANSGNSDAIGQGPIVVVKRLILKRGYDNEDVDKNKKRKHSHKKTVKHLSEKDTDIHELLKHVNTVQVNDTIYRAAYSNETHIANELNEKPLGCRTDSIMQKKDLKNTNENYSHCSENAGEIGCTSMPSSTEGVLATDILSQNIRTEDIESENSANNENNSVSSCSENIFRNNSTEISEQQKVSQKIPKVIIKRTVGIDNTNNYRSFLTDGVLSSHARHSWNPVVRLERNASLDCLAKKLVSKNKSNEETFAQSVVRHGIKINLRSPPGKPAVTIMSLSSAVPIKTGNANHSHKRRKYLYSRKKRGSALEEQNSSITSTVVNISSNNYAESSLFCPSNGWQIDHKTTENQVALNLKVTRSDLNNTNNIEDYVLVRKDCTKKDFTKITFHRHKKKRRKTECNKRKRKSCSNFGQSLNGPSKHAFRSIKNGVLKEHFQLNACDSNADEGDKNTNSAGEKSVPQETEQTAEIFLPPKTVDIELNERQSTNFSGCIASTSKDHHISELSDLLLSNSVFTLENRIQKQSFVKSNKKKKRHIEEELITDELPLFHPDRILTYSCSSKNKRLKFKEKSQPPDEQELEKEIKDLCLEMALPSPSNRRTEETSTSAEDAPEHGKVISKVCKNYGPQVAGLKLHNCPEMMCCQVNGHLYEQHEERTSHIKQHSFHCQQCHLSFKSEDDFVNHLAEQHPGMRTKHHCLLCECTFPTAERHKLHLAGQTHRHLELIQRRTIHALFSLFTGHSCPVLEPLTEDELAGLSWLPVEPGTIHFYHQSTPLQQVIQALVCRKERNFADVATATTQRFSPTVPAEDDSTASEYTVK